MEGCKQQHPPLKITFCDSALDAVTDAHAVVLITEWEEFRDLDLAEVAARASKPVYIDGRNFFSPEAALLAGLDYSGIGRAPLRAAKERTGPSRPATAAPTYDIHPALLRADRLSAPAPPHAHSRSLALTDAFCKCPSPRGH